MFIDMSKQKAWIWSPQKNFVGSSDHEKWKSYYSRLQNSCNKRIAQNYNTIILCEFNYFMQEALYPHDAGGCPIVFLPFL